MMTRIKTGSEIVSMRESGHMLAAVLAVLKKQLSPGMTTKDLAIIANKELHSLGGHPAFLGYSGFPDVICVSINEEVVHGIPSSTKVIAEGDVVGMDFGVNYRGMITDGAISVIAGKSLNQKITDLVLNTERALLSGIDTLHNGVRIGNVANAIENVLVSSHLGIVRDYVGHGVGHQLHEEPNIPNYGSKGTGPTLKSGMTIAIEPMATLGQEEVFVADDNWTVITKDQSVAAHFENTVLVTDTGYEILTI